MTGVFVAGHWRTHREALTEILKSNGYAFYVPAHPEGEAREKMGDFVGVTAAMDSCDILVAEPGNQFEIGYMYAKDKVIVVFDDLSIKNDSDYMWLTHRPATFVVRTLEQLAMVFQEFREVSGELQPPDVKYAEAIGRIKATLKYQK